MGRGRTKGDNHKKTAHDGLRHPVVQGEVTDRLLEEILFAAVDRDPDPAEALPTIDIKAERERLEAELRAVAAKIGDISHMLRHNRINRARYDEWCDELDAEREELRAQLGALEERYPVELLADGVTLRELWPAMPFERRSQWLDIVFKKITVKPAINIGGLNIATRFEFEFADGYEPPAAELEELMRLIEIRWRQEKAASRIPSEIEDEMFNMHASGRHPDEIAAMLTAKGLRGPRGGGWSYNVVTYVLRRVCAERKAPYAPVRRRRWFELPDETLDLMLDLYKKIGSFSGVAGELNRLRVPRPRPGEWNGDHVRDPLLRYARKQNVDLEASSRALSGGRGHTHVTDAVGETIWRLRFVEKKTLRGISEWLKRQGIKSPTGRDDWPLGTVNRAALRVDRMKRYAAEQLQDAA
jgi:hypothetical protein